MEMKTTLRSSACGEVCTREEKERGGGKREPLGMATDFDLQILVIYVMFKLTIWVAGTDDRVINFEP